jgi:hypothetical protein
MVPIVRNLDERPEQPVSDLPERPRAYSILDLSNLNDFTPPFLCIPPVSLFSSPFLYIGCSGRSSRSEVIKTRV